MSGGMAALAPQVEEIVDKHAIDVLWVSSMGNLEQLVAFCPKVASLPIVLYMHEFQAAYPENPQQKGFDHLPLSLIQMHSSFLAGQVWFNSDYLRHCFLRQTRDIYKKLPTPKHPLGTEPEKLAQKCVTLYPPLSLDQAFDTNTANASNTCTIAWNHRWAFDKQPDQLFQLMEKARDDWDFPFCFVLAGMGGTNYLKRTKQQIPTMAPEQCKWVPELDWESYRTLLSASDFVLSTATQENFGLSVLEGLFHGALPIVPDAEVYPELYPDEVRYKSLDEAEELILNFWQQEQNRKRLVTTLQTKYRNLLATPQCHLWDQAIINLLESRPHKHLLRR